MDSFVTLLVDKILSTDVLKALFICALAVIFNVFILFGFLQSFLVLICYVIGFYVFYLLLNYVGGVAEVLSLLMNFVLQKYWHSEQTEESTETRNAEKLLVPEDINDALDQFLSKLLDHYFTHWYSNISSDVNFFYEIRVVIQTAVSVCYQRLCRVKVDELIFKKALPVTLNHMSIYNKLKDDGDVSHLHMAVHSRATEVLYLQNVSKSLLQHILPDAELHCKSSSILIQEILARSLFLTLSDAVCNPDGLNPLLLRYLNGGYDFLSDPNDNHIAKKEILHNFVSKFRVKPTHSCLRPDLPAILKDLDLREAFMLYLKTRNADHILQFYIDVEIFNEKLLKPNLEGDELDNLYRDAWDIYSVYFSSHSPNCIKFDKDLASLLRKVLSKDVLKLRNTTALFEAYDQVFIQMEGFCHDFHTSSEFYLWLYGRCESSDLTSAETLSLEETSSLESSITSHKIKFELGTIIKDALNPTSVLEGQVHTSEEFDTSMELGEDVQVTVASSERNMNNWAVSIPTVGSRLDPITNKAYAVFVIQVQAEAHNEWIVERRPNDFGSLDAKLKEFHGSFADTQLPPRRMLSRSECIQAFEEYLNKLTKNPVLKNSELLYTFLTSTEEFEEEETTLGKLLRKSVVPTLRKERGQNLEVFINSFISSCRMTKYEWKDVSEKQTSKKRPRGSNVYGNNFDISPEISKQLLSGQIPPPTSDSALIRPSNSVIFLGVLVYNLKDNVAKLLLSLQAFFGGVFDQIIIHITKRYCKNIITSSNIAYLINLIERTIFDGKERLDPEEVKLDITNSLNSLKHDWLHPLYSTIYEMIQDPKLNKQLYYQLMDTVLEELFPELKPASRT